MTASYRAGFTDATRPEVGADRVGTLLHRQEVPLPENVKAGFEAVSPVIRVLAFLLDLLCLAAALFAADLLLSMTYPLAFGPGFGFVMALKLLAGFLISIGYFFLFEVFFSGRTPGKFMMKLRVIQENGEELSPKAGLARSFIRLALLYIPFLNPPMTLPLIALAFIMFFDRKSRGLPDFVAGTYVISERNPRQTGNRPYVPPYVMLPYHHFPLNHAELSRLTPLDYAQLEEFGARLSTIHGGARSQAAMAAAAALAKRMKYSHPIEPAYAELFLFEMHAALKQQLQQLYPDLYA
jgi:uncharacterized RDD family membrane protein YckC